jgi:hypothetical protein
MNASRSTLLQSLVLALAGYGFWAWWGLVAAVR